MDRHTDGKMDGRMDNVKTVYPPPHKHVGGIKMHFYQMQKISGFKTD